MKSRKYTSLILGATFLSLALLQTAGAAMRSSALTLSPMIGAHFFSDDQNILDRPTYDLGIGYNFTERLATELNLSYLVTKTASGVKDDVEYAALRLDLLYHFPLSAQMVPYVAAGVGEAFVIPEHTGNDKDFIVGYGGGVKYFMTDDLSLRCDVRHLLDINDADAQRDNTVLNNFTATAGIFLQLGGRKAPAEKISAAKAAVAQAPAIKAPVAPTPAEKALVAQTPVEKAPPAKTPAEKALVAPAPAETALVAQASAGKVLVESSADSDGDGITDKLDLCPGTPTKTAVDGKGCPVTVAFVARAPVSILTFSMQYPTNQSDLRSVVPAEDREKLVEFIRAVHGQRIIVDGHADSVGSDGANMKLSQRRAEKIKEYLTKIMAVPASLIEVRGFGEKNPVADNSTQEGRRQNRRVVITVRPQ